MNAKDILFYGDRDVLKTFERVPKDTWDIPGVCGTWTAKDVLSHLTSYELLTAEVFQSLQNEHTRTPYIDQITKSYPEFNNEQVTTRRKRSPKEILQEYSKAHQKVMWYSKKLPKELFLKTGVIPWYGSEYCLDDFIVYLNYGHKKEHLAQISIFLDHLKG